MAKKNTVKQGAKITFRRVAVVAADYEEANESYLGWCVDCERFTTGCCEPDARKYTCEVCGGRTVFGAEEALIYGMIEIESEPAEKESVAKYMPIAIDGEGNLK
jgi:hypothetical protein